MTYVPLKMAHIYLDLIGEEKIDVSVPNPGQIMINFQNVCRPRDVALRVHVRNLMENSPAPGANLPPMFVPAIKEYFYTVPNYKVTLSNLTIDDPKQHTPNELNRNCSKRLREAIPLLQRAPMKCIILDASEDEIGHYGIVRVYVSSEESKKALDSCHGRTIDGRVCSVLSDRVKIGAFRCFRCQMYDHDVISCPSPVEICLKCGGNHRFKCCMATEFQCVNCLRANATPEQANHMAGTFYCPIEKRQRAETEGFKRKQSVQRAPTHPTAKLFKN